jgi:pimeloyl-ACP methyl ester carboxylesterase
MVKPLVVLLPPLGHTREFYAELSILLSEQYEVLCPDYPYTREVAGLPREAVLDHLARHFIDVISAARSTRPESRWFLGGVSLGATLSIRMLSMLKEAGGAATAGDRDTFGLPETLFLMAPGGLRVSRARKEAIATAMDGRPPVDFLRQSLAIDGACMEESSFPRQFCHVGPQVERYWTHYAFDFWQGGNRPEGAEAFFNMIAAALEVDYEAAMDEDAARYVIVWSEKDKVFSPRMYRKFQAVAPAARFLLLDDTGHYAPLESPQRMAELMSDFIGD